MLGSDVLFCKDIAENINKQIKIKAFGTFEGALNAVKSGNADFYIGSLSATNSRETYFDIIKYYTTCASILVKTDNEKFFNISNTEEPIQLDNDQFCNKKLRLTTHNFLFQRKY
ncbi:transporter substrate-binding domain-containing protein [Candidatus Phytoplasma solani]|uniref:transporter substrate-binding domain-containing protein n=1 Tax=Candidatus Phytoplasma solani TaxID=69896 RepID=UPI00358E1D2C